MKKHHLAALTLALLSAGKAGAQADFRAEGIYLSPLVSLQILLLDAKTGTAAASATTSVPDHCGGWIAGLGRFTAPRTFVFSSYSDAASEEGKACRITAQFDQKWQTVRMQEGPGCTDFHGMACAWEGQPASRVRLPRR